MKCSKNYGFPEEKKKFFLRVTASAPAQEFQPVLCNKLALRILDLSSQVWLWIIIFVYIVTFNSLECCMVNFPFFSFSFNISWWFQRTRLSADWGFYLGVVFLFNSGLLFSYFYYYICWIFKLYDESEKPWLLAFLKNFCSKNFNFIGVQLIYNVVLVSGVQQSDSIIHIFILFLDSFLI